MTSASDAFSAANSAFVDEDYNEALDQFNLAIELDNTNPEFFINRAAVHLKLENFTDAISDTNAAIKLNPGLSKAYFRKGVACFNLSEFETAKIAFTKGAELDASNSQFKTWLRKCNAELQREQSETPATTNAAPAPAPAAAPTTAASAAPSAAAVPPPAAKKPKYRHEFYQTATHVNLTVYIKGANSSNSSIEFSSRELSIEVNLSNSDAYQLHLTLWGEIVPAESSFSYAAMKIDIKMKKATGGKWDAYEAVEEVVIDDDLESRKAKKLDMYPSSKGLKNWDSIASENMPDSKPEGDEALNSFFREIYGNASEETRRAMNKSFVESNGTVLSTNWSEVGQKTVEGSAPKGMDMKTWKDAYA